MPKVSKVKAYQILDCRADPTVKVQIVLDNGVSAVASVPSGKSKGKYEALELRDKNKHFCGRGVQKACQNIEEIIQKAIKGFEVAEQKKLDNFLIELDGTPNKSKLGANAILAVSLAYARVSAKTLGLPLFKYIQIAAEQIGLKSEEKFPYPMLNILNGGVHASNNVDIQEFIVIPQFETFSKNIEAGCRIYKALEEILKSLKMPTLVGDEGGFAPNLSSHTEGLELLKQAVEQVKLKLGKDVFLGIDVASSQLYKAEEKFYYFNLEKVALSYKQLTALYKEWQKKFHLLTVEDGLAEEDYEGWSYLTNQLKDKLILVGDDLFVTNPKRLEMGIEKGMANAVLVKVNQIGTLTESLQVCKLARQANYKIVISHRSGETTDDFIADLAYGIGADFIKAGAPARGERVAKYNKLLEIEFSLNK